jgi:uncharacterized protein YndB with AHSA1/START domain
MSREVPDRLEKHVLLRASVARVWRALTDAREFGAWFRVALEGEFAVGASLRGKILYPGYEHLQWEVTIETLTPEREFAFRWHPYAVDASVDYSKEPTTLVQFLLEEQPGGTSLTVIESGFQRLPAHRRDEAFRMNSGGWTQQLENVQRHVGG